MSVEETINKWFEDAQNRIALLSQSDNSFTTSFCAVAVAVMKLYCRATGHLIDNHFRLPTMALLRVISEFFIKFLWCTKIWTDNEVKERMARWEKTSAQKKLKLLDDLLKFNSVFSQEQLNALKNARDRADMNIKSSSQSGMPNVTGSGSLFEDTATVFGANISSFLYGQYCDAIHIPTSILTGFVKPDNQNLFIKDDVDESPEQLGKICLNFAYMFLKVLYHRYRWDMTTIQKGYEDITGSKG